MTQSGFIKHIAKEERLSLKELGFKVGRGKSTSFGRTVIRETTQVKELKKIIELTGEKFTILYKGERFVIE